MTKLEKTAVYIARGIILMVVLFFIITLGDGIILYSISDNNLYAEENAAKINTKAAREKADEVYVEGNLMRETLRNSWNPITAYMANIGDSWNASMIKFLVFIIIIPYILLMLLNSLLFKRKRTKKTLGV